MRRQGRGTSIFKDMGEVAGADSQCIQKYNQDVILIQGARQTSSHPSLAPTCNILDIQAEQQGLLKRRLTHPGTLECP